MTTPVPKVFLSIALAAFALLLASPAHAVVLASDDFNAEGGGVGFAAEDEWGNLADGASDTAAGSPAFRAFDPAILPFSTSSIFISFDFHANTGANWGGLAFFEGIDGGPETLFIGNANGVTDYAIDLKGEAGNLGSGVPIDDQTHKMVVEVLFGSEGDTYRLWVDNFNHAVPNNTVTLDEFVIAEEWQSVRVASDVGNDMLVKVDNLVIATTASDVDLTPSVDASVTVNRATGEVTLSSPGGLSNVVGYSLRSSAGSFDHSGWNTVDGRDATDAAPAGDGSLDNDDWQVISDLGDTTFLSEATEDATPGDGLTLTGAPLSFGDAWELSPFEDVFATVVVDQGGVPTPYAVEVTYTGAPIDSGDLDGDGDIDLDDWNAFKSGQGVVSDGMTTLEAYRLGDLDGNGDHNLFDFDLFAEAFDSANGAGSFQTLLSAVPEPTSALLMVGGLAVLATRRRRLAAVALLPLFLVAFGPATTAQATIFAQDDFSAVDSGTGWASGDAWEGLDGGLLTTHPGGGGNTVSGRNFLNPIDATDGLTYVRFDYRQEEGNGSEWGGFAFFEGLNIGGDESFFAGANPGGIDNYGFDVKVGGNLDSGVAFDSSFRTIIGSIDTTGEDTVYKMWVDNFDVNTPSAEMTITGQGAIDAPWRSLRFQAGGNHEFADNLLIADAAEESLVFQAPEVDALELIVNKATGEVSISNGTQEPVDISAYSIASPGGMLNSSSTPGDFNTDGVVDAADYTVWRDGLGATHTQADYDVWASFYGAASAVDGGWESLAERESPLAGFPQGGGDGLGWEEGGSPSVFEVEEYFLTGESTVSSTPIALGNAYGGGATGAEDLTFRYRSGGELLFGDVTYVGGASVAVPEPASLLVCLLGLGLAAFRSRSL